MEEAGTLCCLLVSGALLADPLSHESESFLSRRTLPPLPDPLVVVDTGDDGVLGKEDEEPSLLGLVRAPLFCLTAVKSRLTG